jgi:hypothetical protein
MSSICDNEIPHFKIGDVFYECEAGINIEARVTEPPVEGAGFEGKRQWRWKAVNTQNGQEIDYLITEGLSHYGPRLYRSPQYCGYVGGEIVFPLLGGGQM